MKIKRISCGGFKTYRDLSVAQELDPAINSIVGLNGSGKSTLFHAILFVVCPAHGGICSSGTFLHEGSDGRAEDGFVEIEIENNARAFPIDMDSVVLKRTLCGIHRNDEFYVNGKAVHRSEYITMLQTANLAGVNAASSRRTKTNVIPYYIVEQGRVASTASVSDEDRFKLLREAVGLDVFDEKRTESLSILEDTDSRRVRISELMEEINRRCEALKQECSEMEEYYQLRRERDRVEFRIGKLEASHFSEVKEKLLAEIQTGSVRIAELEDELTELEVQQAVLDKVEVDRGVFELEEALAATQKEIKRRRAEIEDLSRASDKLNDQLLEVDQLVLGLEGKRRDLTASIEVDKVELGSAKIHLNKQQGIHADLTSQLQELESSREENNFERRDELELILSSAERRVGLIEAAMKEKDCELIHLQSDLIPSKEAEIKKMHSEVVLDEKAWTEVAENQAKLSQEARELNGVIFNKKQRIFQLTHESDRLEKEFREVSGSVLRSSNWNTRDLVSRSDIKGVKGLFGEFIRIPPALRTAVESSSRGVLFQIMIESDQVADEIARKLAGGKGKVTLTPINRLTEAVNSQSDQLELKIKKSGLNAELLSSLIVARDETKEEWVPKAVKKFFSRIVLVDSIDTGVQIAREFKLDAVTVEGDLVSKDLVVRGGGDFGGASRKFGVVRDWQQALELKRKIAAEKAECKKIEAETMIIDQSLRAIEAELSISLSQKSDASKKSLDDKRNQLFVSRKELASLNDRKTELERYELVNLREVDLPNAAREVEKLQNELSNITNRVKNGEGSSVSIVLSESERKARIECSVKELRAVDAKIHSLERTIQSVSKKMNADQAELVHFVNARLEHLSELKNERQSDIMHKKARVGALENELQSIQLGELSNIEFQLKNQTKSDNPSLVNPETLKQDIESRRSQIAVDLSSLVAKVKVNQSKVAQVDADLADCLKNLPLAPIGDMDVDSESIRELRTRIVEINKQLNSNKFAYLNKRSLEEFERFNSERQDLELRRRELDHSHISLVGLLEELRLKEQRIISSAFDKVSKRFTELFTKATGSSGLATMNLVDDKMISIQVAFPSGAESKPASSMKRLHELSGGQRTVVSLCYLLALGRAEGLATNERGAGSRFFILDEVDAALDANYRSNIAEILFEESLRGTQFILTSFRPEFCSVAHKHWRVSMVNGSSTIDPVDISTALSLVNGDVSIPQNDLDEVSARE